MHALVKRIGSKAWRVTVAEDGRVFSLAIRTEAGLEYEVLLGTVDSTPILTDLLSEVARVYAALPPPAFSESAGPNHPKSVPLRPLGTRVERHDGAPVLALDFGGTVLKIAIDPMELQQGLSDLTARE
ncbi:hypothetical protein [Microvirga brassicacearum]|uniref:Uncharacterized protein n=1 Tax=Microvirga brassicacearum TaxID=2580413 RepID=A0A5N3P6J6_9HYPH|nr:hypothetical protein [Microvirga brassicacearum]KAB0265350.1 hypothetical protein FEZ63_18665 [Microvirga brassicacearum]